MLAQFRDYLKTLNVARYYYIGKIENSKEYALGVYSNPHLRRVEAIGKVSTYDVAGFRLLLHWNRNEKETEIAARELYQKIRYITETEMDDVYVYYIDIDDGEPVFVGTDDNGVYEYHISGTIYYGR